MHKDYDAQLKLLGLILYQILLTLLSHGYAKYVHNKKIIKEYQVTSLLTKICLWRRGGYMIVLQL